MKKKWFIPALLLLTLYVQGQHAPSKPGPVLVSVLDGEPVAGAVITLLHNNTTALSQTNGSFSIPYKTGDSLRITHTAFDPIIMVAGKDGLPPTIMLQPHARRLEEVQVNSVNTGYQSIPKERATGSFETINNSLFNQQTSTTVLSRLETIANGLIIDKKTNQLGSNVIIRGLSTIRGPKSPLIILDNFPYEGDLNNINPNDVESITLLKDAAAASIWGTKAGNGVIVITTKKARFGQPMRIELNNNITITGKPDLFYYNNITPSDFIDLEIFLYGKGYFNSQVTSTSKPVLSPVVELLVKKAAGTISAAEADAKINAMRSQDLRDQFNRYMYRPSVNQQHAITIRGGTQNIAYLFSAGYDNNIGSLNEKYRRVNFTSQNTFRVTSRLQFEAGITFTQSKATGGKTGYNTITTANGNLPIYTVLAGEYGKAIPVMKQYRQAYIDTAGAGKLLNWNYYALDDHDHISTANRISFLVGKLGISYKIYKGLSADIKYQYQMQSGTSDIAYDEESYFARNLINYYSQLNRSTGIVTYKVPTGGILNTTSSLMLAHNVRGQLNYARKWKVHELNILAGAEIRHAVNESIGQVLYGYNADILTAGAVDYTTPYPNFINGTTSFIPGPNSPSGKLNRFVSFFGNAAYTFLNRYTLTASGRRDASNLFGVNTNDKWTPLWSAGISWEISREHFYRFTHVPYLKLRATYGYSGNADPTNTAVTIMSYQGSSQYTLTPQARIDQFANPELRWEKIAMFNMGIDFRAFGNRVQGSVEYYHKNGKDLFGNAPVDYTAVPTNTLDKNVASMKGHGWDISINTVNLKGAVTWLTSLNVSTNKDKVVKYNLSSRQASNFLSGGNTVSAIEGRPVYSVYTYRWAGLDPATGDPMGWLNGIPSKDYTIFTGSSFPVDSLVYNGPAFPVISGSMGNTISFKGISVTARLSYKFGHYFIRSSVHYLNLFAGRQGHGDYALRWQKPGDEQYSNVPSLVYPAVSRRDQFYNGSEVLVEKADHIRLQYITLDYDIKKAFKRLPLSGLNLYININNLGILWRANKQGIDPDYRDNTILPSKNYAIGIRTSL